MIGLASIEIASGINATIHGHDILVNVSDVPLYHARVVLGKNVALHHGFDSIDSANEWARTVAKKIEKQHKELLKHEYRSLQS
jgi:hypothetical protein